MLVLIHHKLELSSSGLLNFCVYSHSRCHNSPNTMLRDDELNELSSLLRPLGIWRSQSTCSPQTTVTTLPQPLLIPRWYAHQPAARVGFSPSFKWIELCGVFKNNFILLSLAILVKLVFIVVLKITIYIFNLP